MSDLCTRLGNVDEAGIYRLGCSIEALRESVAASKLMLLEVDLSEVQGKGAFLAALADAIHAPSWFGHNFDALADALVDLSWLDAPGYVLLLTGGGAERCLNPADRDVVEEIFAATVEYWREDAKPFWIFFS